MSNLETLLEEYVSYNSKRIYSLGDYIIRYHDSFETLCLYECIKNNTTGDFKIKDWKTIECVSTGFSSPKPKKAAYLGQCATDVVYATRVYPERYVPRLPKHEDEIFDNVIYIE